MHPGGEKRRDCSNGSGMRDALKQCVMLFREVIAWGRSSCSPEFLSPEARNPESSGQKSARCQRSIHPAGDELSFQGIIRTEKMTGSIPQSPKIRPQKQARRPSSLGVGIHRLTMTVVRPRALDQEVQAGIRARSDWRERARLLRGKGAQQQHEQQAVTPSPSQ